ncbi:hypothetical protein PWT90_08531 [Aphanocladium album]|nr:hypothetical protein PWT90_08531 [Aphanocladium album]
MLDDFRLEHLNSGVDGANVIMYAYGLRFSVTVYVERLPADAKQDMPSQRLHRSLQRLCSVGITDDEYGIVSKDIFEQVRLAGHDVILRASAQLRRGPVSPRLADHLFRPIALFELADHGDHGVLLSPGRRNKYFPTHLAHALPGAHTLGFAVDPSLPEVHVDDVVVLQTLARNPVAEHVACKVAVHGEVMFCKAESGGVAFGDSVVGKDFQTMLEIRAALANLARKGVEPPSLKVPGLRGVLRHPEEGHVIGFLRDWIDGVGLDDHDTAALPDAVCEEWDSKVLRTVSALHELDVYWGAPDDKSVIIDRSGEPWVVDFGAKVDLGFRREQADLEEGDWDDYEDSVYDQLQPLEEIVSEPLWSESDEPCSEEETEMSDVDTDEY